MVAGLSLQGAVSESDQSHHDYVNKSVPVFWQNEYIGVVTNVSVSVLDTPHSVV